MYSYLTDGSQELYPGVLTLTQLFILTRCTHSQLLHLTSLQVLLSVTLGCGSALALYPAESTMKHLGALLNPGAPHRCVTGIHSPPDHFPGPSQLSLT